MIHVLQLGPYPPPEGGITRNILAIREELQARGHRCSIIATSKSTRITDEPDVYHPRRPIELIRLLRSLEYDVLHLHVGGDISGRLLTLISVCSMFRRRRNVLSLHSGGYSETTEGRAARKFSVRGSVFRRFARVIAVNPLLADVFSRYGIEKANIRIINPFVARLPDPQVQIPTAILRFAKEHSPLLLSVGQLEAEYGLDTQIEALRTIVESYPYAGLIIVGSGSLEAAIGATIAAKPYADNIYLAGNVEHAVTLHLIDKADILLRTTLYDGDAISVREALFLGTPVIATDNKMRPSGVDLVGVGDPAELSEKILSVAARTDARSKDTLQRTADTENIDAIIALYAELLGVKAT